MLSLDHVAVVLVGYLLGSIPFAVILSKRQGVDVYKIGSNNPGATNVVRHVGKGVGRLVFALDFLKGLLATLWFRLDFITLHEEADELVLCAMLASVLGHSFPAFSKFRGGKGVATAMGALLGVMPVALIVGLLVWLSLFFSLRYVSLASIGFGLSLPLTFFVGELMKDKPLYYKVAFAAGLALWIAIRHQSNLRRLLAGEEDKSLPTASSDKKQDSSSLLR